MRKRFGIGVVSAVLVGVLIGAAIQPVMGQTNVITTAIKLFGIGYVVKTYGDQINSAINSLMLNNKAKNKDMTKVVPILSVGIGIISRTGGRRQPSPGGGANRRVIPRRSAAQGVGSGRQPQPPGRRPPPGLRRRRDGAGGFPALAGAHREPLEGHPAYLAVVLLPVDDTGAALPAV